jgi:hypothetical protein
MSQALRPIETLDFNSIASPKDFTQVSKIGRYYSTYPQIAAPARTWR